MSTTTPFNLTIVLPKGRQYYVSYFYPYEYYNNSINTCKYHSNVTTALEEGWHTADIYNEYWKDNPTRGEPINGNVYEVPFTFTYSEQFVYFACTYFIFSYYENEELHSFAYILDTRGGHSGGVYETDDYRQYLHTDASGNLLVYVGFLTDYAMSVFAPGRTIGDYTLTDSDVLIRSSGLNKCKYTGISQRYNMNEFPEDMIVNGYYIYNSESPVVEGTYQLQQGFNSNTQVPELIYGNIRANFGIRGIVGAFDDDRYAYIRLVKFKFTRTNDSDPTKTLYRILHFESGGGGDTLTSWGELYIDAETKELKIWSRTLNPEMIVLKQLTNDEVYAWHEVVFKTDVYGNISDIYFDGTHYDLIEMGGRTAYGSFRAQEFPGFPDILGGEYLYKVAKDKSMLIDYAGLHIMSEAYPYIMRDNYFDNTDPLPDNPDTPDNPEEEDSNIKEGIYLVCYKGETSIFDKLIRIIKTNLTSKEFPPPPIDPRLRHLVGRLPSPLKGTFIPPLAKPEHILNVLPKNYPVHKSPRPIEVLLSKILNSDYTHVGLWVVPENTPVPEEITYYACREDAGVMEYTEAYTDVDLYKIKMPTVKPCHVKKFFEKTQYKHGSMIGDMGYRHLMHEHSMSSVEWVAAALNLAFPFKYTINKLIDFANLEE